MSVGKTQGTHSGVECQPCIKICLLGLRKVKQHSLLHEEARSTRAVCPHFMYINKKRIIISYHDFINCNNTKYLPFQRQ